MSKTWKWILGIVLVLILVGAMFTIDFAWRSHTGMMSFGYESNWNNGWQHPMMGGRGYNDGRQYPMMGGRGFLPFGGFAVLGGLVRLVLFFGVLYGAYWLGKRNARFALDPKPVASVEAPAASKTPEQDS
jgi:hypothetical protein